MEIQALSIRQPWASLIGMKIKPIEIRSWSTRRRGTTLIVASKEPADGFPKSAVDGLPKGAVVAIVEIENCRKMKASDAKSVGPYFYEEDFAFVIGRSTPIFENIPIVGQLNFYQAEIPDALLRRHLSREDSIEKPIAGLRLSVGDWKRLRDTCDPDNRQHRRIISLINEGIGTTRSREKNVYIPMPTKAAFSALQLCGQDGITFSVK